MSCGVILPSVEGRNAALPGCDDLVRWIVISQLALAQVRVIGWDGSPLPRSLIAELGPPLTFFCQDIERRRNN